MMRLAVLVTNTDTSDFAARHPSDAEKFSSMIATVRPEWRCVSFDVTQDVFPKDIAAFDGVMITGSPASVHDPVPWVARLLELIREIDAQGQPMFGACLGHQAIALALGGTVVDNPEGWAFGRVEMTASAPPAWFNGPEKFSQYAAHSEQVIQLPAGTETIFTAPHCLIAGFTKGTRIYTTQNHPEMTHGFITALVEEYASSLGPDGATRARASLHSEADADMFAQSIARFFEQAG